MTQLRQVMGVSSPPVSVVDDESMSAFQPLTHLLLLPHTLNRRIIDFLVNCQ